MISQQNQPIKVKRLSIYNLELFGIFVTSILFGPKGLIFEEFNEVT